MARETTAHQSAMPAWPRFTCLGTVSRANRRALRDVTPAVSTNERGPCDAAVPLAGRVCKRIAETSSRLLVLAPRSVSQPRSRILHAARSLHDRRGSSSSRLVSAIGHRIPLTHSVVGVSSSPSLVLSLSLSLYLFLFLRETPNNNPFTRNSSLTFTSFYITSQHALVGARHKTRV